MKVLFIGDIVGRPGRAALAATLPELRERHAPDLVIANGENAAGGLGITERNAKEIYAMGVDVITLGNHSFRHRDVYDYLDREQRIIRPANYMTGNPGRGSTVVEAAGRRVGVINLSGTVQLRAARSPFPEVEMLLDRMDHEVDVFIVDFHAEVTSEKVAMGWHLDGRVAAVLGTHTHVPTADARVLPKGTAFISDVGMTGSRDGVLGVRWEQALEGFRTQMPIKFSTAEDNVWINGAVVTVGDDGLAESIEQVLVPAES
ncbi:MAG: TIGR00282 family metallophosphoesterase [bacterium]